MWKFSVVCAALLAFGAPALAQNSPPPPEVTDQQGGPGVSPGMLLLGAAGLGLAIWGISAASKKSSGPVSP